MIELNEEQLLAVTESSEAPPLVMDPKSKTIYVLVRKDLYEKLKGAQYDDSPWTDEEMELLAWEAGKHAGWEDMDQYDDYPEKK